MSANNKASATYGPGRTTPPLEARIAAVLTEAWDAGNCTGLDGWVGPGRGAGQVDGEAMSARERDTAKLATMLTPVIAEAQSTAWVTGLHAGTRFSHDIRNDVMGAKAPANPYRSTP